MTQPIIEAPVTSPVSLLHPSNLLTYVAVVLAATAAIAATTFQNMPAAGAAMALAVIADTFDGKFSRRFTRTPFQSAFGVQLDSLADAITSGFVPVIVMTSTALGRETWQVGLWAVAALAYVVAALTRLGYYNLTESQHDHFIGLPAPAASLFVCSLLLFDPNALASGLVLAACAIAMVAPMRITRPRGIGLLLFAAWALVLVGSHAARLR
jgi:CDP-diacylglycerol---serine O-phosphatidyltransferase